VLFVPSDDVDASSLALHEWRGDAAGLRPDFRQIVRNRTAQVQGIARDGVGELKPAGV
jgi:hypothetical protein